MNVKIGVSQLLLAESLFDTYYSAGAALRRSLVRDEQKPVSRMTHLLSKVFPPDLIVRNLWMDAISINLVHFLALIYFTSLSRKVANSFSLKQYLLFLKCLLAKCLALILT